MQASIRYEYSIEFAYTKIDFQNEINMEQIKPVVPRNMSSKSDMCQN